MSGTTTNDSRDETLEEFLTTWREEYSSGGFLGYLRYLAETGFVSYELGDRSAFDEETGELNEDDLSTGIWVWSELLVEWILTGLVAAVIGYAIVTQVKKPPIATSTP